MTASRICTTIEDCGALPVPSRDRPKVKACWPMKLSQHALSSSSMAKGIVSDELTTASRQADKTAASHHQPRQARSDDWAGHVDIHRPGVASLTAEYVGNEDVKKVVRGSHVSNRRVSNAEGEAAGDPENSRSRRWCRQSRN